MRSIERSKISKLIFLTASSAAQISLIHFNSILSFFRFCFRSIQSSFSHFFIHLIFFSFLMDNSIISDSHDFLRSVISSGRIREDSTTEDSDDSEINQTNDNQIEPMINSLVNLISHLQPSEFSPSSPPVPPEISAFIEKFIDELIIEIYRAKSIDEWVERALPKLPNRMRERLEGRIEFLKD